MPDFDISGRHQHQQYDYGDKDKTNISIKKTTGHHTHNVGQRDMLQASTSVYQEEYVPPVDTPVLDPHDPQASSETPKNPTPKPGAQFRSNFETLLRQLPPSTLKGIATTSHEARAMLRFAHANPDVPMDPKVRALLKTLVSQAAQQTREDMNLGSDWQPPEPHTGEFNARISDELNSNFENHLKANFSGAEYKSLRLAYYHPDLQSRLSPELQGYLKDMKQQAYQETQSDMGFPKGWQPPPDSSAIDDIINGHFTNTFDELVAKLKQLSPREQKELKTLFRFPNAKVPDREKLQEFLKELTHQAHASAKKRFGLPDDFNLSHQSHIFKAAIKGGFGNNFQREVLKKLRNGEISHEQAQKLMASKGTDPAKLPSNLQNIYTQARQNAAKQTAQELGLPENWQPTEESSDTASGETTAANQQQGVRNADGSVRVKPNTPVQRKGVNAQQSQPIDPLTAPASNRDTGLAIKAINYYQQAVNTTSKITAVYFTGPEQMLMGDSMLAVSSALDNLRVSTYGVQMAEARAAREVSRGQNDAQEEKIRKELEDMRKPPPKTFFLFKILRIIPIVNKLADKIEGAMKLLLWAVDVILGGAVNMITQAIGMEPITENPFLMMGWINEEEAKKMDMALGILVMVAEMAVSAVLAQPELVMAQVAAMTARLSEAGATTAAKIVSQVTKQAVTKVTQSTVKSVAESAAKSAVTSGAKVVTRQAIQAAAREAAQQVLPEIAKEAAKEGIKVTAKQASKQALNQTLRLQAKAFVRKIFDKAKDIIKAEARQQIKRAQNYKQTVTDFVYDPMGFAQNKLQDVTKIGTKMRRGGGDGVDVVNAAEGSADDIAARLNQNSDRLVKQAKQKTGQQIEKQSDNFIEQQAQSLDHQTTQQLDDIPLEEQIDDVASEASEQADEVGGELADKAGSGVDDIGQDSSVASRDKSLNQKRDPKTESKEVKPDQKKPEQENVKQDQKDVNSKEDPKTNDPPTQEDAAPSDKSSNQELDGESHSEEVKGKPGGKELDPETELKMELSKNSKMNQQLEDGLEDVINKLITKELKDKGYKIVDGAERQAFKDTLKAATEGKSGFSKLADGVEAGAEWVKAEIKEGVETGMKKAAEATKLDKVGKKLDDVTDQVANKLEDTKVGKLVTNITERFASSDTLINDASRLMKEGGDESLKRAQRKLIKASAKRMVEQQQSNFRFMMDIKDYIQDTIQFASYTAQAIMYMKKSDATMKAAENQAFIQEMDTYIEMEKKAVDSLLKGMEEMASWINDINQQESTFWKKMEIRFIAA